MWGTSQPRESRHAIIAKQPVRALANSHTLAYRRALANAGTLAYASNGISLESRLLAMSVSIALQSATRGV